MIAIAYYTGLGTLGKSLVTSPLKTLGAINAFRENYNKMREASVKRGNLKAHEEAKKSYRNYWAKGMVGLIDFVLSIAAYLTLFW